jgi:hypothetical protein
MGFPAEVENTVWVLRPIEAGVAAPVSDTPARRRALRRWGTVSRGKGGAWLHIDLGKIVVGQLTLMKP